MKTCDDCGGQGGEEVSRIGSKWDTDPYGGEWLECPTCAGSGWICGEPDAIDPDELDEYRGSIDDLIREVTEAR